VVAAVRSTSGIGVAEPASFIRTTYGLGERAKTASIRTTYGIGELNANAGIRTSYGSGFVSIAAGAPTVVAGPAQTVFAGALVQLVASIVLSGGATLTSITWRLVTRDVGAPLPTLSATNVQNPTVQAVPAMKAYSMTFGVTAKDSLGRTSAESLVVITVHRAERARATTSGFTRPIATGKARLSGGWG
jgi:hypothetical protein